MLPKNVERSNVDIWSQDETRVGQQGSLSRIWAKRGTRPRKVKQQQSRSMEMRYFWLLCQEAQKMLKVSHHTGLENLGDYPSKAHFGPIHRHVRPYYLHMPNSPPILHRASMPSTRRGCAEILGNRYHNKIPLPRIPPYQGTGHTGPVLFSHAQARTEAR